ncbi:hypothetical protein FHS18_004741 [Paenibacillus phyllosphaerae]|uniref:Uncharacterized protein n=1 Tax=Paenibacillus phyllosphaerae TaxID=274593 RepID=A0A7W5B1D5_9BACL|nr:hypothetical protein [Paenibacillus phyllosphaerae]MBB3112640.1 hypothetical protein [Paenibacillus phyllosphaerae]
MKINILKAELKNYGKSEGFLGFVHFAVEGHKSDYELTLKSKNCEDWMYSLNFLSGPGKEIQINQVEEQIEENDELFDTLIDAALDALEQEQSQGNAE